MTARLDPEDERSEKDRPDVDRRSGRDDRDPGQHDRDPDGGDRDPGRDDRDLQRRVVE